MRYALKSSFRCFWQPCCWQARTSSRPTFLVEEGNDSSLEKNVRIQVDVRRQSRKCCQPRSFFRKNVERMHTWSHTKGRHNHGLRLYLGLLFGRIFFGFSRTRRQFSEGGCGILNSLPAQPGSQWARDETLVVDFKLGDARIWRAPIWRAPRISTSSRGRISPSCDIPVDQRDIWCISLFAANERSSHLTALYSAPFTNTHIF